MDNFFFKFRPPANTKTPNVSTLYFYYVIVLYKSFPKNINLTPWNEYHTLSAPLEWIYVIDQFSGKKTRQYANFTYFPHTRPISDVIFGLYAPFYLLEKVFESFFGVIFEIIAIFSPRGVLAVKSHIFQS